MVECQVYGYTLLIVVCQTFTDKIEAVLAYIDIHWNLSNTGIDVPNQFYFVIARKGRDKIQRFKYSNTKTPHIDFVVVKFVIQNFWRHIQRCATVKSYHLVVAEVRCKAEVSELDFYVSKIF